MKRVLLVLVSFILLITIWGVLYWKQESEIAGANIVVTIGKVATSDKNEICGVVNGLTYSKQHRQTSEALKRQVYKNAGVSYPQPIGKYEVDHEVPLCLGGADELQNLQLEPAEPRPAFHEKDLVEAFECRQVCSGSTDVQSAQAIFTQNKWLEVYKNIKTFGSSQGTDNIYDEDLEGKG